MKYKGYTGRILNVDLTTGKIQSIPFSDVLAENSIGGVGAAADLMRGMVGPATDPLGRDNPLVFMTGPLTGTQVPWSGRHCVAALSPLTGIWGEAYAGGTWGKELKKAGCDGLVITGRADSPVYLKITDRQATIEDASALRGMDTYETEAFLRKECGGTAKVAACGPAGEKLVRFAAVLHDGPAARAAGRCGLGAVMGAKNLKAVAVSGSQSIQVAAQDALMSSIRAALPEIVKNPEHRLKKARAVFSLFVNDGRYSVRNWRDGELAGFDAAVLREIESHIRDAEPYRCAGCPTGCVESTVKSGVRQTLWESISPLGSQCGITDMGYVRRANDLCNRFGIDTISAGGVISFAMECFEEGLITEKDTDGVSLKFGSGEAMLAMLEKICSREGFGAVLAEGTRRAAHMIGKGAEQYAVEVKGLEVPAHDPRAHNFLALAYATDNRGANHTGAADPGVEGFDLMDMAKVRFSVKGTAATVARGQDYAGILNSLVLCAFSHAGYAQYDSADGFTGLTARHVVEWFNLVTGMEKDFSSLMRAGNRAFTLRRLINLTRGLDASADCLHERFMNRKRGYGPAADHLPQVQEMVRDYYRVRGWDADGKVSRSTLEALGLGQGN